MQRNKSFSCGVEGGLLQLITRQLAGIGDGVFLYQDASVCKQDLIKISSQKPAVLPRYEPKWVITFANSRHPTAWLNDVVRGASAAADEVPGFTWSLTPLDSSNLKALQVQVPMLSRTLLLHTQ